MHGPVCSHTPVCSHAPARSERLDWSYAVVTLHALHAPICSHAPVCSRVPACSERLDRSHAVGARKAEACAINTSLSSVGDVFEALSTKQKHVPFRNSKLTYLLKVNA